MIHPEQFFDLLQKHTDFYVMETGVSSLQYDFFKDYYRRSLFCKTNNELTDPERQAMKTSVVLFDKKSVSSFRSGSNVFVSWDDIAAIFKDHDAKQLGNLVKKDLLKDDVTQKIVEIITSDLPQKNATQELGLSLNAKEDLLQRDKQDFARKTEGARRGTLFDEALFLKTEEGQNFWIDFVKKGQWDDKDVAFIQGIFNSDYHAADVEFVSALGMALHNTNVKLLDKENFITFFDNYLSPRDLKDLIDSVSEMVCVDDENVARAKAADRFLYARQSLPFTDALRVLGRSLFGKDSHFRDAICDLVESDLGKENILTGNDVYQITRFSPKKALACLHPGIKDILNFSLMEALCPWNARDNFSWDLQKQFLGKIEEYSGRESLMDQCRNKFLQSTHTSLATASEEKFDFFKTFVWTFSDNKERLNFLKELSQSCKDDDVTAYLDFLKKDISQGNDLHPEWVDNVSAIVQSKSLDATEKPPKAYMWFVNEKKSMDALQSKTELMGSLPDLQTSKKARLKM